MHAQVRRPLGSTRHFLAAEVGDPGIGGYGRIDEAVDVRARIGARRIDGDEIAQPQVRFRLKPVEIGGAGVGNAGEQGAVIQQERIGRDLLAPLRVISGRRIRQPAVQRLALYPQFVVGQLLRLHRKRYALLRRQFPIARIRRRGQQEGVELRRVHPARIGSVDHKVRVDLEVGDHARREVAELVRSQLATRRISARRDIDGIGDGQVAVGVSGDPVDLVAAFRAYREAIGDVVSEAREDAQGLALVAPGGAGAAAVDRRAAAHPVPRFEIAGPGHAVDAPKS